MLASNAQNQNGLESQTPCDQYTRETFASLQNDCTGGTYVVDANIFDANMFYVKHSLPSKTACRK
ncbi:hypothetical protein A9308_07505 [Moraxella atlantae]|uniref:Uncharacterized protein n=1 Tax=Faucicola atlantae TaxID=34059 RepID=A0A1B8QB89_9GAMM|nr:hypothetical protein A9308_07505 [Moraxella atlantae]